MPAIHFLDVTNRDGVQTARTGLSKFGKIMVNFYLGQLGVAQSELGFPFLFHEVPYIRASVALAEAGAFGGLRLSGWCRAVPGDVAAAVPLGLRHYNLSISTSDQMIVHKFRGKLDRESVISEMVAAVRAARDGGAETIGVNAEDGSRTDEGFLLEFAHGGPGGRGGPGALLRHDRRGDTRTGSASASPSWPRPCGSRSRPIAITTSAWRWPTQSREPSGTWTPARTRG